MARRTRDEHAHASIRLPERCEVNYYRPAQLTNDEFSLSKSTRLINCVRRLYHIRQCFKRVFSFRHEYSY
ncbi:MAG: hypothetical protein ABR577_11460 [Pyrinomonadaceae bacterium]